jgi:hypothetical protein
MTEFSGTLAHDFTDRARYGALMDVMRNRLTTHAFDSSYVMLSQHYEMILEQIAPRQIANLRTTCADIAKNHSPCNLCLILSRSALLSC